MILISIYRSIILGLARNYIDFTECSNLFVYRVNICLGLAHNITVLYDVGILYRVIQYN